jgi:Holliday junction resolvasome RuvABC ATP-dependent DNA helicase subunit
MNETDQVLERFITGYRSRQVPPPHILLVGPDSGLNESIARKFAARLGVDFEVKDAATVGIVGDLTSILWGKRIAFIGNIHLLKRPSLDRSPAMCSPENGKSLSVKVQPLEPIEWI